MRHVVQSVDAHASHRLHNCQASRPADMRNSFTGHPEQLLAHSTKQTLNEHKRLLQPSCQEHNKLQAIADHKPQLSHAVVTTCQWSRGTLGASHHHRLALAADSSTAAGKDIPGLGCNCILIMAPHLNHKISGVQKVQGAWRTDTPGPRTDIWHLLPSYAACCCGITTNEQAKGRRQLPVRTCKACHMAHMPAQLPSALAGSTC
eukprot:GHRR01008284.1.p2 GENE.GHRR01008284.1~~GHRR01008284.1.p2  ORF type:complete len:204 (-),score=33.36 GHRR01008284.1:1290-1901(-)